MASAGIARVEGLLEAACGDVPAIDSIAAHLKQIARGLGQKDVQCANTHVDLAILAIRRCMATELPLRSAFGLVDGLLLDVKRHIARPSDVMDEAVPFAEAYLNIWDATGGSPDLSPRPIPAGVEESADALSARLRELDLPAEGRDQALQAVGDMAALAAEVHARGHRAADEAKFMAAFKSFGAAVGPAKGIYITERQARGLVGRVIFGWPAWLCATPVSWVPQAIGGYAILLSKALEWHWESEEAKSIGETIGNNVLVCKMSYERIKETTRENIEGLELHQLQDIRDFLDKLYKTLKGARGVSHRTSGKAWFAWFEVHREAREKGD